MIKLVGDIHAEYGRFIDDVRKVPEDQEIIQVGDFGFWPSYQDLWERPREKPVYVIDGNHEWFPIFEGITEPTELELYPGVIYVPRGTVMEIDGVRVGFLGGASSVDKAYRTPGWDWFAEENIRYHEVDQLLANGPVDLLVTHSPSAGFIMKWFDRRTLERYGLGSRWRDTNAFMVDEAWKSLGCPVHVFGHMHRSIHDAPRYSLGIHEWWEYDSRK